jgi:hypothetical protein
MFRCGGSGSPASACLAVLPAGTPYTARMLRWFLVIFLALMFISWLSPFLRRMGFGRLPGDLRFRWLGRDWDVPLASTLLLSFGVSLLVKWL